MLVEIRQRRRCCALRRGRPAQHGRT
jgi:hypothetical protein